MFIPFAAPRKGALMPRALGLPDISGWLTSIAMTTNRATPTEKRSIAVIGAGPAGLMAAERLSAAGHQVTVYDQMPSVGRKLLMAGRGGLNLTHSEPLERFLQRYGETSWHLIDAVSAFPPEILRAWAEALGQETFIGSSGRVFPRAMKASPLLRSWLARLADQGVRILTRHRWIGWDEGAILFSDPSGLPLRVHADATLLALGGASWPRLGSDGNWVDHLARRGVELAPLAPSNMGVNVAWGEPFRGRFVGQPLKNIAVNHSGTRVRGEAVVTAYGLEGGAIYALSSHLRRALEENASTVLEIDLRPELSVERLAERLSRQRKGESRSNALRKTLSLQPIQIGLLREASASLPAEPAELAALIKAVPLTVTGVQPVERAISTAGGVSFSAIDENFMLRAIPGTFVAGEMLDWDAPTGGYLLQASFATGMAAAVGIERWLNRA